jgi:hypothetical protein
MGMPTPTQPTSREEVLEAMAEVMERQARVARAEAALSSARRRLGDSVARLSRLQGAGGERVDLPSLAAAVLEPAERGQLSGPGEAPGGTLRERIVVAIEASPGEVFTPARLAPVVGSRNRDSVRNTLLVLAAKGRIEKLGAGQYQARKKR